MDCDLESYCKEHKINNVIFQGAFKNEDKPVIYEQIDFINAIYGNTSLEVTTALPNRLYDGILFKKPIIASEGTYLGEIVSSYNIGVIVKISSISDCEKTLNNYLDNFDSDFFCKKCDEFLLLAKKEQKDFKKYIAKFLN